MSRTFSARRQWIATEHSSVQEILSRYPALEGAEVSVNLELAMPFGVITIADLLCSYKACIRTMRIDSCDQLCR